jgi:hypothetical protein
MRADEMRKMAAELRAMADTAKQERMVKAAQVIEAAKALHILRKKVTPHER